MEQARMPAGAVFLGFLGFYPGSLETLKAPSRGCTLRHHGQRAVPEPQEPVADARASPDGCIHNRRQRARQARRLGSAGTRAAERFGAPAERPAPQLALVPPALKPHAALGVRRKGLRRQHGCQGRLSVLVWASPAGAGWCRSRTRTQTLRRCSRSVNSGTKLARPRLVLMFMLKPSASV